MRRFPRSNRTEPQAEPPGELKPVIDRCYSLHDIAEARRDVDQGHKKGNVVIRVMDEVV